MRLEHSLTDIEFAVPLYGLATTLQPQEPTGESPNASGRSGIDGPVSSVAGAVSGTGSAAGATTGSASPAQAPAGSGASPSWIASISDATIRNDMSAASAGGTVSETGMAQLFSDLAGELAASNTTLSASQFNDLRTIANDLSVGETASSYVTYVTDALIDGNAANGTFTGGAASVSALGNLAVGSTATQIAELNDKWFLGTDLPSSTVQLNGDAPFSVYYAPVSNPVFGASGPTMADINQGVLGDCYLLSSLAEVACQDPSRIQSMITDNGNNSYGVRFFVNGVAQYVTVSDDLADSGTIFNRATNIWASLVEQAYAQIQGGEVLNNNYNDMYGNSFSSIGNGGFAEYALEETTGASTITDFNGNGTAWTEDVYNNSLFMQSMTSGLSSSQVLATLAADLAQGDDVVLSSYTEATDANGNITLVSDHAMSVYGYDSATGELEIRNPWGTESWQNWDTTFEVSLNTLLAAGDTITVDNMASTPSIVTGAAVSAAAALQADATVAEFTIADTAANVSPALASLAADSKLLSITLTDSGTPNLTLTASQFTADSAAVGKIVSAYTLTVTGASAAASGALQANPDVTGFAVTDTAANVTALLPSLNADSKLTALSVSGTSAADTLNLTGSNVAASIYLNGDSASARGGLAASTLRFIGAPDSITLESGASTINYTLAPSSGIETIFNFRFGLDQLDINLNGAAAGVLHAANTTYGGQHAISFYSSADPAHGVVLANTGSLRAATLLAGHVTFNGGVAVIA